MQVACNPGSDWCQNEFVTPLNCHKSCWCSMAIPPHPTVEVKKISFYKLLIINEMHLNSIIGLISPDSICNLHILHILLWKIRHFSKAVSTGSLAEQPNVSLMSLKIMFSWKISFKYIWKKSNIDHYFAIFKFLDIFNPTVVKLIVLYKKHLISNLNNLGNYFPWNIFYEISTKSNNSNKICLFVCLFPINIWEL